MADFMIRFFICNIFISGIIGILLTAKRIFKNDLSSRMQYNLWFLLLGLLAVPFIPFRLIGFLHIFSWLRYLRSSPASGAGTAMEESAGINPAGNADWMNDFALSVNNETPSIAGYILLGIWVVGILAMIILMIRSSLRLRSLQKSALPLQNKEVRRLYNRCLEEMELRRDIPVYSTAFLKSPIIVGLLKPRIYLPIHLISDYTLLDGVHPPAGHVLRCASGYTLSHSDRLDGACITGYPNGCNESDLRYMLLHELQHYKHHDAVGNILMNLTGVIYWFNPLVWYSLKEMRNDREVACDTSVLKMLKEEDYEDYGNTLINFAEKISLTPFPFAAGLGGNMQQMKRRIINIASYEKPTFMKRLKGMTVFILTAALLIGLAPFISTYAADGSHYQWHSSSKNISYADLSAYFGDYEGSFVLYDLENDTWNIHDIEHATLRVAPNSTYKIYDALFGLEEGVITPENSFIAWNGESYPFEAWNADQTLQSAMNASVNWYFQSLDRQLGKSVLQSYLNAIGYGNQDISGKLFSYWMESTLKISPIEQVELLTSLYQNDLDFTPEHIQAVKNSIRLSASDTGMLYGKTGTGGINGQDISGWFVGYVETTGRTCFFATNIKADYSATGSAAAEITMSILSDLQIWK